MSIIKVFGGLWLENLVKQDKHYEFVLSLYKKGYIQGLQLLVAHPIYYGNRLLNTEEARQVISALPADMEIFIHVGSEIGQVLDECGHYNAHSQKNGSSWKLWNQETLRQAVLFSAVLNVPRHIPWGVVHAGYALQPDDPKSIDMVIQDFGLYASGVALEGRSGHGSKRMVSR